MYRRHYNIVLMIVWLIIAAILIVPDWVAGEKLQKALRLGGAQGSFFGIFALVLAAYNGMKWWYTQNLHRARNQPQTLPLHTRRLEEEDRNYVPNPELDFFKPAVIETPSAPPGEDPSRENKPVESDGTPANANAQSPD